MGKPIQSASGGGGALVAWCRLLRVPNLLTVPGDPVVGYFLALASVASPTRPVLRIALAAAASLLMYSAGLLWNDWFDLAEDRLHRPDRPLPSGRVRPLAVAVVANVLMLLALAAGGLAGVRTLYVLVGLGLMVILYNAGGKRVGLLGPALMGLCRGASVLVGAAAAGAGGLGGPLVWLAAVGVTAYVASVTAVAARETRGGPVGMRRNMPAAILAFGLISVGGLLGWPGPGNPAGWAFYALGAAAVLWAAFCAVQLARRTGPKGVQKTVGRLLRGLLLVQGALVLMSGAPAGLYVAAALLAAWVPAALLARRFWAS